ncbi:MAG: hypothetical protein NTX22_11250 [Ignavibacteriales bacterium]|nr:hypothetical protein [Ignavibacteriales bacterium]
MDKKFIIGFILFVLFCKAELAQDNHILKNDSTDFAIPLNNIHLDLIPFFVVNNASLFADFELLKFRNSFLQYRAGVSVSHFFHFAFADGGGEVEGSPFSDLDALIVFGNGRKGIFIFEYYAGYSYRINLTSGTEDYPSHLLKYGFEISWMFWKPYIGMQLKVCLTKSKNGGEHDIFGLGFTIGWSK